jgi:hypothetical protein
LVCLFLFLRPFFRYATPPVGGSNKSFLAAQFSSCVVCLVFWFGNCARARDENIICQSWLGIKCNLNILYTVINLLFVYLAQSQDKVWSREQTDSSQQ